jgi:hypothetical protein
MAIISRTDLYHQIWKEPVRTVAGRYNISDVALAKACKKYRIPLPPRGYWSKVNAGHHPPRPLLPRMADAEAQTIRIEGDQRGPSLDLSQLAVNLIEAEKRPEAAIRVSGQLVDPHREVRKVSKSLKAHEFGNSQRPGILSPDVRPGLDVTIYRPSVDRALRIMDALLKAFESRGWSVEVDGEEKHSTSTIVLDERVFFFLDEKTSRSDHRPTPEELQEAKQYSWHTPRKWDFKPSGLLRLQIVDNEYMQVRTVWQDGEKGQRLETLLNDFLIGIVKAAEAIKRRRAARAEGEKRRHEERLREIERDRLRALEESRVKELQRQVDAYHRVARIRIYLAKAQEAGLVYLPKKDVQLNTLEEWCDWATKYAKSVDPFRKEEEPDQETD